MKQRINPAIIGHLIRGAFYLLLLLAVCTIPFALAQRDTSANTAHDTSSGGGRGTAALPMPEFPMGIPMWDQYNNPATEPPINIGSQDFEPALDASDD